MQKILLVSTLLLSSLLADHSLGEKISVGSAQETINQNQRPIQTNTRQANNVQVNRNTQANHLTTRISPSNVKRSFKKDHHRYDKRYQSFDYQNNSYYNDDGYYYGYYDNTGYFYNNIFFTYDNTYTYPDRYHRRGHFDYGYNHRRHYIHHRINNWNSMHSYREQNAIVFGHYYDRSYYPRSQHRSHYNTHYGSNYNSHYNGRGHYNNYRSPARMNVTRMNGHSDSNNHRPNNNYNRSYNTNRNNNYRNNNYRNNSHQNSYGNRNYNTSRSHSSSRSASRGQARMSTRGSSRHMGMSK